MIAPGLRLNGNGWGIGEVSGNGYEDQSQNTPDPEINAHQPMLLAESPHGDWSLWIQLVIERQPTLCVAKRTIMHVNGGNLDITINNGKTSTSYKLGKHNSVIEVPSTHIFSACSDGEPAQILILMVPGTRKGEGISEIKVHLKK